MSKSQEKRDKKVPLTDEELVMATGGATHGKADADCPKFTLSGESGEVGMGCMWNMSCLWNKLTQQKESGTR